MYFPSKKFIPNGEITNIFLSPDKVLMCPQPEKDLSEDDGSADADFKGEWGAAIPACVRKQSARVRTHTQTHNQNTHNRHSVSNYSF